MVSGTALVFAFISAGFYVTATLVMKMLKN